MGEYIQGPLHILRCLYELSRMAPEPGWVKHRRRALQGPTTGAPLHLPVCWVDGPCTHCPDHPQQVLDREGNCPACTP